MNSNFFNVEDTKKVNTSKVSKTKQKLFSNMACLISKLTVAPKLHHSVMNELNRWYANNGPEWTVNRLKAYWNIALLLKDKSENYKSKIKEIISENSISYRKAKLIPKGAIGKIVQIFVEANKAKTLKRASAVLRLYTSIRLDKLTDKQYRKYRNAICGVYTGNTTLDINKLIFEFIGKPMKRNKIVYKSLREFGQTLVRYCLNTRTYEGIVQKYNVPIEKLPYNPYDNLKGKTFYYDYYRSYKMLNKGYKTQFGNKFGKYSDRPYVKLLSSLLNSPYIPTSLWKYAWEIPFMYSKNTMDYFKRCELYGNTLTKDGMITTPALVMGQIKVIQEQGAKARVVAMPTAALQRAFEPMNKILVEITKHLPESCVKDQSKGVYNVITHNRLGHKVISVDLSSATDRFPREISLGILDGLGLSDYSKALEIVSSGAWEDVQSFDGLYNEFISYKVGQPMGLQGSFSLFNLSNILLARFSKNLANFIESLKKESSPLISFNENNGNPIYFYIIGDDVIFSDERIANVYKRILTHYGVKISEHKSFNNNISEFAGYITYKTGKFNKDGTIQSIAFRPYKTPDKGYISNPLQLLDVVRDNVVKLNNRHNHWVEVLKAYKKTLWLRDPITLEPYTTPNYSYTTDPETLEPVYSPVAEDQATNSNNKISLDEFLRLITNIEIQQDAYIGQQVLGEQSFVYDLTGKLNLNNVSTVFKYMLPYTLTKNRKPDLYDDVRQYDPNSFTETKSSDVFEPLKSISKDPLIRRNKDKGLSMS